MRGIKVEQSGSGNTSRRTAWMLTLFMIVGIVPLAKSVAYVTADLFLIMIRLIDYDAWIYALHGESPQYITLFAFLNAVLEAVMTAGVLSHLFPVFGLRVRSLLRFGQFHWSFLPIILIVPLMPCAIYVALDAVFHLGFHMGSVPPWNALWMLLIVKSLAVPLTEELGFRGLLFSRGQALGFSNTAVVIATGLAFSFMHISAETGVFSFIVTLPAAFCTGWLRLKSGAIFWPILLHAIINCIPLQTLLFLWYAGNQRGIELSLQALGFSLP
ncbi:CAAX prenyl protease-like protein [Phyllobacterium myrsinacearum]|nr:CAAX prenyl protease-like protein [Phyllobacterium myrsinacearum]RZV09331.1 CAAX prenyl protease-like protein [Phyllobacterium myrsinacearum]